mmetsp:Transcript_13550/g.57355  ORF Transcript_13550/g.57355 Transcript_13550/m.57355 type:complete len:238 (-) Transcript_13550:1242-1955(-)
MSGTEEDKLPALLLSPRDRVLDEVDSLLRHQAGDAHHQRLVRIDVHAEAHLQVLLAQRLTFHRAGLEVGREEVVQPRVPNLSVDAVDHPAELRPLLRERLTQETGAAVERLPGVRRGHGRDVIGVDDGSLHQAQSLRVVPDGSLVHSLLQRVELASGDARRHELLLPALAGVVHVVDRQHHLGVGQQALSVIHVPVEHRDGAALPLVHVEDVGVAPRDPQALQRRSAEGQVRLGLVI